MKSRYSVSYHVGPNVLCIFQSTHCPIDDETVDILVT